MKFYNNWFIKDHFNRTKWNCLILYHWFANLHMSCVLKETWVHCMKWVPHVKLNFLCPILFVVSWVYNESLASGGSHQNLHELSQDVPQRGRRRHVGGSQNSGRNPYLTYFIHTCSLQNTLRGLGPFCFEFVLAHLSKWLKWV